MNHVADPTPFRRDKDIREPLLSWIASQHVDDGLTGVFEEFEMPRPSARIDVAVVNGELAGFEIKSDADTLVRLGRQVAAFSSFFDKVSLVTTKRHLLRARKAIPSWWGIMILQDCGTFKVTRLPKQNRFRDPTSLLYALSKNEIRELAKRVDFNISPSLKKAEMVGATIGAIPTADIFYHARDVLRLRAQK